MISVNNCRYAFTVISNITVYGLTWLMLDLQLKGHNQSSDVTPKDAPRFQVPGHAYYTRAKIVYIR